MQDIMLDLETMGVNVNAPIVTIDAVGFDANAATVGPWLYLRVDLNSAIRHGGVMDAQTVLWWLEQSDAARSQITGNSMSIVTALESFSAWIKDCGRGAPIRLWGNGADFDNVILASAYRNVGREKPWLDENNRCYRAVKNGQPDIKIKRIGTHHNAVDDAESQAWHLIALLKSERQQAGQSVKNAPV